MSMVQGARRKLRHASCFGHFIAGWVLAFCAGCAAPGSAPAADRSMLRVLVFTRTAGFRHDSIPAGVAAMGKLGSKRGFEVEATEDPNAFTPDRLAAFRVVVFLNTTGDVLDAPQQDAFERYIRAGGGFVGIHSAADTEYEWTWYGRLVGAHFKSHPQVQPAKITTENGEHPSTRMLPRRPRQWERIDEWYNYRANPRSEVHVLMNLDTSSYVGDEMGGDHPIAWCHEFQGGRAWYTGGGHTSESFSEPLFLEHIFGGIMWAAGRDDATEH